MWYEKRLRALEVRRMATRAPAWGMVEPLRCAVTEAVRAKIARRLDGVEDTPEQAAQDAALLNQWRAVHGDWSDGAGARARLTERLDRMAERQRASTLNLTMP